VGVATGAGDPFVSIGPDEQMAMSELQMMASLLITSFLSAMGAPTLETIQSARAISVTTLDSL